MSMVKRYRSKPKYPGHKPRLIFEAIQVTPDTLLEVLSFLGTACVGMRDGLPVIQTIHGMQTLRWNDYVLRDGKRGFGACGAPAFFGALGMVEDGEG